MVPIDEVPDLDTAKQVLRLLQAENERLHRRLQELVAEIARLKGQDAQALLQRELTKLQEQLALMQQRLFGASSEKRPLCLSRREQPQRTPAAAQGHGPRAQPELPVQEVLLPLDEADQVCGLCGGALHEWKGQTEDSEEVTVVERQFVLRKVRRQKYRCPKGCAPVTAPAPPRLVEGGRYSVEFAVHVALQKYAFHLPLARQERMFRREGLVVERQTLWDQIEALADHLRPSYEALPAEAFCSPLIHADETHWYLLDKGPGKKWYAWTVASPDTVYHRILPSRSGATAKTVLGDYAGVVVVDGYAAYQTATKSGADGLPTPSWPSVGHTCGANSWRRSSSSRPASRCWSSSASCMPLRRTCPTGTRWKDRRSRTRSPIGSPCASSSQLLWSSASTPGRWLRRRCPTAPSARPWSTCWSCGTG